MNTHTKLTHRWQFWIAAVLFGVLLPLLGIQTTAQAADTTSVGVEQQSGNDNGGGDDDEDGREIQGIVQVITPTGGTTTLPLIGIWTINDKPYTTTAQTEFKHVFGSLGVGACVKVHLRADGTTVREMESQRDVHCTGDDDDGEHHGQAHGKLFGAIVSFPSVDAQGKYPGIWEIGDITVTAGITTEFIQSNGTFTVGKMVKVEFIIVNPDDALLATEIKTAISPDGEDHDHDDDDGHHGHHDPMHDAKAFGNIEAITTTGSITADWQIGGILYTVITGTTELDDDRGELVVGQNVKVEYTVDGAGNRTAKEIKSMPAGAGGSDRDHSKLVGFVETPPPSSFEGKWIIGGAEFMADATSRFEEEHGLLIKDAYVEVEYRIKNNVRLISKLETRVPPGAGDDDHAGIVEQMDDDSMAAAVGANSTWRIGGNAYTVTPATSVSSGVTLNNLAVVNSYTAADGSQVATRISSVTLNSLLFLPATRK